MQLHHNFLLCLSDCAVVPCCALCWRVAREVVGCVGDCNQLAPSDPSHPTLGSGPEVYDLCHTILAWQKVF